MSAATRSVTSIGNRRILIYALLFLNTCTPVNRL